jgi:uncharacterized protein (TIGR00251 family)
MTLDVRDADGGSTLRVRVRPRASREQIEGEREGALVVRLTAPPVEGEANAALARLLAKATGLAPSSVKMLRGATGREKLLKFEGLAAAELRRRLETRRS